MIMVEMFFRVCIYMIEMGKMLYNFDFFYYVYD